MPQTADAVRARAFYEGVLGLSCLGQDAFALVFKTHHGHLRIIIAASLTPAPLTVLGWEVPDVAAGVQALMAMGVTFEIFPGMTQNELGVWTSPSDAQAAWFKDPDGNLLSLTQAPAAA